MIIGDIPTKVVRGHDIWPKSFSAQRCFAFPFRDWADSCNWSQRGEFVRFTGGAKKAGAFRGNREAGLNDFLDTAATIPTPLLVVILEAFSVSVAAAVFWAAVETDRSANALSVAPGELGRSPVNDKFVSAVQPSTFANRLCGRRRARGVCRCRGNFR